jgi:hypothetical protein
MQAMICSPHYYRLQMEVKEDLSDIWKEEDPDYKFLNYTRKKHGKAALVEKGMSADDVLPCGLETGPADGSANDGS